MKIPVDVAVSLLAPGEDSFDHRHSPGPMAEGQSGEGARGLPPCDGSLAHCYGGLAQGDGGSAPGHGGFTPGDGVLSFQEGSLAFGESGLARLE